MTRSTDILKELEQISPAVAKISDETPYQVPVGYFDTLDTVIMARIAAGGIEENTLLDVAGKQMPQDVPQGYFDNLTDSILSKIKAQQNIQTVTEELSELSPLLAGLSKTNLYEVPAGYFENLSADITEKTTETKVVSMFSRKVWIRYAAAAVVFGLIAFGIYFFSNQSTVSGPGFPTAKTEEQINTGHGGGDFFIVEDFANAILTSSKPEIDVYQACEWTAVALLSELSVTNGGKTMEMPKFRRNMPYEEQYIKL